MPPWSSRSYVALGKRQGLSEAVLINALTQANYTAGIGLPPILTLNHLATQVEVPFVFLRKIVGRRHEAPYRFFSISKRDGRRRLICVPNKELVRTQKWIARYVLANVKTHSASVAYAPGASIVDAAARHCLCTWLVKLDIKNFFESISERRAYRVFRSIHYQPLVSFELARICTRTVDPSDIRRRDYRNPPLEDLDPANTVSPYKINLYKCPYMGHLPQGAPTSPMLSNLAMIEFDEEISKIATECGLTYTRYSDDLTFSTSESAFTRHAAMTFITKVTSAIKNMGFEPQWHKTAIIPPGARKTVLGLLVDGDVPRLTREFRANLEQHIYFLKKNGPAAHAEKRGFLSLFAMRRHIEGLISFAHQVDIVFANSLADEFRTVAWPL